MTERTTTEKSMSGPRKPKSHIEQIKEVLRAINRVRSERKTSDSPSKPTPKREPDDGH